MSKPTVVCLCGSTRFHDAFRLAEYEEAMAGRIVLSVGFHPGLDHAESVGCTPEQKLVLDELHLRRIDLADEVLVLNVAGYVGESTARELAYAVVTGKAVRWLRPDAGQEWVSAHALDLARLALSHLEPRDRDIAERVVRLSGYKAPAGPSPDSTVGGAP